MKRNHFTRSPTGNRSFDRFPDAFYFCEILVTGTFYVAAARFSFYFCEKQFVCYLSGCVPTFGFFDLFLFFDADSLAEGCDEREEGDLEHKF